MKKEKLSTFCEVLGSGLAMVYALLIASNTGNEVLGFILLLVSALAVLTFLVWGFVWQFSSKPQMHNSRRQYARLACRAQRCEVLRCVEPYLA